MPRAIPDHERRHVKANWRNYDVLNVREAACVLNTSETSVRRAMSGGQLPTRRVGKRFVIPVPALVTWLAHGEREAS